MSNRPPFAQNNCVQAAARSLKSAINSLILVAAKNYWKARERNARWMRVLWLMVIRCSAFFHRILIPTIAPGIAVPAFCCFMFSWVEYVLSGASTAVAAKPISGLMSRAGDVAGVEFGLLGLLAF